MQHRYNNDGTADPEVLFHPEIQSFLFGEFPMVILNCGKLGSFLKLELHPIH